MPLHKDHGKKPTKTPPGHHMMDGKPMADKDMNKEHKGKMPMKGKGHG